MATTTTALVSEVLQELYGDLYPQINKNIDILNLFNKGDVSSWNGKYVVQALHHRRNQSTKSIGETGNLPTAGNQEYEDMQIPIRDCYTTIKITGRMLDMAEKGVAQFTNVFNADLEGAMEDAQREMERIICGDGLGVLGLVDGAGDDNATLDIDAPGGVTGDDFGNRFIFPTMELAIHATDGLTVNAVRTCDSVNTNGTEITLGAAVSSAEAVNNGIVTKGTTRGSVTEGSYAIEPMGIRGLFDDGTFVGTLHTLDRTAAANQFFNVKAFSSVGALSEDLLHRALNACWERSGYNPSHYLCHTSVHREVIRLTQSDRRYTGEQTMRPDPGIKGQTMSTPGALTFNDVKFKLGRYLDFGTLYLIDKGACHKYELQSGRWEDRDGAVLHRTSDQHTFDAVYYSSTNYSATRNNSSAVLRGISATLDINREA